MTPVYSLFLRKTDKSFDASVVTTVVGAAHEILRETGIAEDIEQSPVM